MPRAKKTRKREVSPARKKLDLRRKQPLVYIRPNSEGSTPIVTSPSDSELQSSRTWGVSTILILLNALLVIGANIAYFGFFRARNDKISEAIPITIKVVLMIAPFPIAFGYVTVIRSFLKSGGDARLIRKVSVLQLFLTFFTIIYLVLPQLYIQGYNDAVLRILTTELPRAGTRVREILSSIVTLMTSGVTGLVGAVVLNLVASVLYDLYLRPIIEKWRRK